MFSFKYYLEESMRPLTPAEWKKPNSQTGESRIDILKRAISAGESVTLTNNKEVVIAATADNMSAIDAFQENGKAFTLKTKDGKEISSSQIGKSPRFGGGRGAGGGTEATAIAESAQCVWLASMLKHGVNQPIEFFTPEVLSQTKSRIDIGGTSLDDVFGIDAAWAYSSYAGAKILIQRGFVSKKHKFHRDSAEMKFIYAAKKQAFKNSGLPNMKDDKWNPGDIWAIEDGVNLKRELDVSSIGALNDSLIRLYSERKVVGISLKLVKKNAKVVELNYDKSALDSHKYFDSALSTSRGNFFSNKGGLIMFDAGKMEIRPNNYLGSNKVEIMGKTARGGGAGWGVLVPYAKRYMNANIPEHSALKAMAIAIDKGDKRHTKTFFDMAKACDRSVKNLDEFTVELSSKDAGWISAKLAATYLCYTLQKNKGKKANDYVTAVVNYAGSKSEDASVYVKVYE